jgi:uncharacterized integral membrane protein
MDASLTKFDRNMAAAAFAEAGEFETAKEFLAEKQARAKRPEPAGAKKPYGKMIIFGTISLFGYVLLISNQKLVTEVFTMGGWHAAYPVGTALIFSFVHGAFASNLLSVLGIEAKKH